MTVIKTINNIEIRDDRKITGTADVCFSNDLPPIRFFLKNGGCLVFGQDGRLNDFIPVRNRIKKINNKIANKRFAHNVNLLKKFLKHMP